MKDTPEEAARKAAKAKLKVTLRGFEPDIDPKLMNFVLL